MVISPAHAEANAEAIRRLYADAETDIMARIARNLEQGIEAPDWALQKQADLQRVQREIQGEIGRLQANGSRVTAEVVEQAYLKGMESGMADLAKVGVDPSGIVRTNVATAEAFVREAVQNLQSTHFSILRQSNDVYRSVVSEALRPSVAGVETRRQAAQRVLNQFADRGITGFRDSAGRNWGLDSYAEMSTRTSLGRAAIQGHVDTLVANDRDLVIVSDSPEECSLCRPWEGKVLSLSGSSTGRVQMTGRSWTTIAGTLSAAQAAGLFHPLCTHHTGLFVPGLTTPLRDVANPEGYKERQRQRAMERNVRQWKRREAVALDDDERNRAQAKVKTWQGALREYTTEHDRKRLYGRESIVSAR